MTQRYVFYFSMGADAKAAVRDAQKAARALGAVVVKVGVGTMLVEAAAATAAEVALALPEWQYAPENKRTEIPERGPLQRTRLKLIIDAPKRSGRVK